MPFVNNQDTTESNERNSIAKTLKSTFSARSKPRLARPLRVSLSTVATISSKNNGCAPLPQ